MVNAVAATTTRTGWGTAELGTGTYPLGVKVSDERIGRPAPRRP